MIQTAESIMTEARMSLVLSHPFFGRLAMRLALINDASIPTACTNGSFIAYNPEFIKSLPKSHVKFVMAHEVMHCALLHPYKLQGKNVRKANAAMDYAINMILVDAGFHAPKKCLLDERYRGMTWERIYNLLPDNGQYDDPDIQAAEGTPADQEAAQEAWKIATAAAIQESMKQGNCPESMKREVEESRKKVVDWKEELWHNVERIKGNDDYSYSTPSRKSAIINCFIPSMYSEQTLPLAVAIDTSGSIEGKILGVFLNEIRAIADVLNPRSLNICCADDAVQTVNEWTSGDDLEIAIGGGGGTDFRPAIAWAENLQDKPSLLIYFTDMYGNFPEVEPSVPVIWISTSKGVVPPFGTLIEIN